MRFDTPNDHHLHSVNAYLRYSDEALALRITEKFLTEVGRATLRYTPEMFDVSSIKLLLGEIRSETNETSPDSKKILEDKIRNELDRWRNVLAKRDSSVQAYEIRRFHDSLRGSLDPSILFALARFYRSMPLDSQSLSKFDLVITRAFEATKKGRTRKSKFNRVEIAGQVRQLFREWDELKTAAGNETCDDGVIAQLDAFISEAQELNTFEALIRSNIFERMRSFKRRLGEGYFQPDCIAATIDCNLVVSNVFAELLSNLNADLHERLSSRFDFAAAFMDAAVDSNVAIADILCDLHLPGDQLPGESNDLETLHTLLRGESIGTPQTQATAGEKMGSEADRRLEGAGQAEINGASSARQRLARELHTLGLPHPDTSLLRDRMIRSPVLECLDLNDFLFDENHRADHLGRRSLAAILCLEEFRETELKANRQLDDETGDEIFAMLQFAERLGNNLADALQGADDDSRSRLLSVSNSLLNSRLRVERAVVRFAAPIKPKVHTPDKREPDKPKRIEEVPVPPSLVEVRRRGFFESHTWLMAIAFVVILIFGSLLLYAAG